MPYKDVSETDIVFLYGGYMWLVPKEGGRAVQVERSQGVESWPKFSLDEENVAYWSDKGGEYNIYLQGTKTDKEARKLTDRNKVYGYRMYWSQVSKRLPLLMRQFLPF